MSHAMIRATTAIYVRQLSRTAVRDIVKNGSRGMASLSGGQMLTQLAKEYPHKDAIRYEHKNQKYTFKDLEYFAESIACGFTEQGFRPGDKVLSWLPLHFSEQHAPRLDLSSTTWILPKRLRIETVQASLKKALEVTEANILVTQEAGSDVNYVYIVKEVIPETRIWDFGEGLPFFSPHFPHLRYPLHTGFDHKDKEGMIPFRHMIVPSGLLEEQLAGFKASGDTPLCGELKMGPDGPTPGKILSNDEVAKHNVWPIYNSILKKEYLEIEGIGNVW
ncbi:ligase [Fragilaria crotonensis]|nr:ligase [Fragilaria crotonensis]